MTVEFKDNLYIVKRKVKVEHDPIIDKWKDITRANKVLKKDGYYWFCELIEDADVIEFIKED